MQVYLAAPQRGVPEFNAPAMEAAAGFLKRFKGHDVFNPAAHHLDTDGFDPTGLTGLESLALADNNGWIREHAEAIALLPGWERSVDVRAVLVLGASLGLLAGTLHQFGTETLKPATEILADLHAADDRVTAAAAKAAQEASDATGTRSPIQPLGIPVARPLRTACVQAPVPVAVAFAPIVDSTLAAVPDLPLEPFTDDPAPIAQATATSGEVRVTSSTGASKGQKLARHDLIPTGPLSELAEHYGRGAVKYARVNGRDNWRNGYDWSLSYSAMQRHANAFWGGQDNDEETGSKHLVAVAWHAFSLIEFMNTPDFAAQFDDRQDKATTVDASPATAVPLEVAA